MNYLADRSNELPSKWFGKNLPRMWKKAKEELTLATNKVGVRRSEHAACKK
jgi:hypothetical protein